MSRSWWTTCTENATLADATEEIGWMREDWQKLGAALGFENFVDPEVMVTKAQELTELAGPRPQKLITLTVDIKASDLVGKIDGAGGLILDIMAEREHQDIQWGGPEHDDQHNGGDWLGYIEYQLNRAHNETLLDDGLEIVDPAHYRERLVKVAALAWAAIEAVDRKHPRRVKT